MRQLIAKLLREKCGAAAIEYGRIVASIALAIVARASAVATQNSATLTSVEGTLQTVIGA